MPPLLLLLAGTQGAAPVHRVILLGFDGADAMVVEARTMAKGAARFSSQGTG